MTHVKFTQVFIPLLWLLIQTGPAVFSVLGQEKVEPAASPLVAPFSKDQAHAAQAAWVRQLKIERCRLNSLGLTMVLIPPGEYQRGTSEDEVSAALKADSNLKPEYFAAEQPQHRVRITKAFYMATVETTQGQFLKLLKRNPSAFSASGNRSQRVSDQNTTRFPVERVTWYDCIEFCNRLSEVEGLSPCYEMTRIERNDEQSIKSVTVVNLDGTGYRLPTEAEWEYACRAGSTSAFSFGDQSNGKQANVDGTHPFGTTEAGPYLKRTSDGGKYRENNFGLHDMCGNVWEWCQDGHDESAYAKFTHGPAVDPAVTGAAPYRVLRGGSWYSNNRFARSASRIKMVPEQGLNIYGFRVVCASVPPIRLLP